MKCDHTLTAVRDFGYPWQYDECLLCGMLKPGEGGEWRWSLVLYKPLGDTVVVYGVTRHEG